MLVIDKMEQNNSFKNIFEDKVNLGKEFCVEDINYIKTFDNKKMFSMVSRPSFRTLIVHARVTGLIDDNMLIKIIDSLFYYFNNNNCSWTDYDYFGYFGIEILISECTYVVKEMAIKLINIPISKNRWAFIDCVKTRIIGNIDPTLEEKIDKTINQ